ncbi:hypothetical protein O6H91_05G128700 [Diphasiastrum complanatum]|uniref:Uncharacterized protein n=1 Tax=Diphasiastrum complanatum TaxID=34168 RepID=A0ACC2DT78_DIPCM|nr:hypothetical protein O6H91_05G128700 [Diphasiastrum complanatum]
MDMRQPMGAVPALDVRQPIGGSRRSQHSFQLNSQSAALNDDLFLFDNNCSLPSSVDLGSFDLEFFNASELSSFLDCNASNSSDSNFGPASLLPFPPSLPQSEVFPPADEGSGTTNTLPGLPSTHQHQCLDNFSPPQSQGQALQPTERLNKQSQPHLMGDQTETLHSAQEPLINRDLEEANRQVDCHSRKGIMQQQPKFQGGVAYSLLESQESQAGIQKYVHSNQHTLFAKNASLQQQQLCPSQETTSGIARKLPLQEQNVPESFPTPLPCAPDGHTSNGTPGVEEKEESGHYTGLRKRLFSGQVSNCHVRQYDSQYMGNQGVESSNLGMGSSKGSSVSQISNVSVSRSLHQNGVESELRSSKLINDAAIQSQAANQISGLLTPSKNFQHASGLANLPNRQSLLDAQTANIPLSSFELQDHIHAHAVNEQLRFQQGMTNQNGYQSMCHPSQQPSFQLLRPESFEGNRSANSFVSGAHQIFPLMQPRLQSQLMQGLKVGGRHPLQHISMGGTSLSARLADAAVRHPVSQGLAIKCEQLLMQYIQEQRRRPSDNSIQFWKELVQKFFMQGAAKRWCLTSYNASPVGRHAQGLFPMDYWFCNLCGVEPGRGFESSTDVLPRLFKIKYESGLLEEMLFLDFAEERYILSSGKIVLEYSKAVHESIFSDLRVVRYGKLRVTFSPSLKIYSWEFCTKAHEEVVPRKNLFHQAHQLANLVNEADQNGPDNNAENLKSHCNAFTAAARNLAVKLDAPMVNDLGFSKRYVRCLQIAEVVNSMKDLISFEKKMGLGPIGSLASFPSARKVKVDQANSGMSLKPAYQIANQFAHAYPAPCSPSLQSSALTNLSGEKPNNLQAQMAQSQDSTVLPDFNSFPNSSRSPNQLQPQSRSEMEARLSDLIHTQTYDLMQPPTPSQLLAVTPAQSQSIHQTGSELVGQTPSGRQALSQLSSEPSNTQQGFNQQYCQTYNLHIQQPYQRQWVQQASSQVHSLSQSLNQHSLPGTPQSQMSDMRSNP